MVMTRLFLIHYGELALKGGNRSLFEKRLLSNIKRHLKDLPTGKIKRVQGALLAEVGEADENEMEKRLRQISGIAYVIPVTVVEKKLDAILETASDLSEGWTGTFRATVKRADKRFPVKSDEVAREVGGAILRKNDGHLKVDLHNPDHTCYVEIAEDGAYVGVRKIRCAGGLPVGSSSMLVSMISGGIDSPVASGLMLRRGAPLHYLHFHNYPYTDRKSIDIVTEIITKLNANQFNASASLINLTPIQEAIVAKCQEKYRVILYRRFMFRLAERIAEREKCGGIVTGEALAQVASQTVENMRTVEAVTLLPVLRPLVGSEKDEIIRKAEALETYKLSIQPHSDCCSLFIPAHPATKTTVSEIEHQESALDIEALMNEALEGEERIVITERTY